MSNVRMHNKHHKKHKSVKTQWEINRGLPTYESGIVTAISQQGNAIYAIVRKKGRQINDVDNNKVYVDTGLFGNIYNVPETDLSMAECLIPTSLDGSRAMMNYTYLIGSTVKVQVESGYPRMVHFENNDSYEARTINREDLYRARASNDDLSLIDTESMNFFKSIGVSSISARAVAKETIKEGQICYGNYAVPDMTSQEDKKYRVMSIIEPTLVVGLAKTELKEKSCHRFPRVLGGI